MLRFPNPGSDFNNLINIFKELYSELYNLQPFTLDDISTILASKNLATSSGYMGLEALRRSTKEDRTKDPMYNQSKMYSEIYKFLGWIHPLKDINLQFQFTYLGIHATLISDDPKPFMRECLLAITYPNNILNVLGGYTLRPFLTILKTMINLDGYISRDEMILGPLSLKNDTIPDDFDNMITMIKDLRKKSFSNLQEKLNQVEGSTGKILSGETRGNNTRFPNAALIWTNWAEKKTSKQHYGKSISYYYLTDFGEKFVEKISNYVNIRFSELDTKYYHCKENLIRLSFHQMLIRSNFTLNVQEDIEQLDVDLEMVHQFDNSINHINILFSPYQELSSESLKDIFPSLIPDSKESLNNQNINSLEIPLKLEEKISFKSTQIIPELNSQESILNDILKLVRKGKSIDTSIDEIATKYIKSNQNIFYPLITELFRNLGFNCINPQSGVNYSRFDGIIIDDNHSIPIEIKSPGEEQNISTKAIRQALENKIILLSRKSYSTKSSITSLVVGFNFPNNRSEVENLINDIYQTYKFKIGIIDFRSLLKLCVLNLTSNTKFDKIKLENLHGYLSIELI